MAGELLILAMLAVGAASRHDLFAPRTMEGCVVTGGQLYAHGLFVRNLTSSEQDDLKQLQDDMKTFSAELSRLKDLIRNITLKRIRGEDLTASEQQTIDEYRNLTAPDRPAFCTGDDTVLYVFDGCSVQNNNVYIGGRMSRTLSADEQQQLKTFVDQLTAYQQYVRDQIGNTINSFADGLSSMFGGLGQQQTMDLTTPAVTDSMTSTTTTTSTESSAPPFPESPKFCTQL